jgi:hypothetical protein
MARQELFPGLFFRKGKNLATKEDIGTITAQVEEIRLAHASILESTKSDLQERLEAVKRQLALSLESVKQHENLKQQAYVDFIAGAAGVAMAQRHQDQAKELDATILLLTAKARIAVYGSKDVLESTGEFFTKHGSLSSPAAKLAFLDAIERMRRHSVTPDEWASRESIGRLLF